MIRDEVNTGCSHEPRKLIAGGQPPFRFEATPRIEVRENCLSNAEPCYWLGFIPQLHLRVACLDQCFRCVTHLRIPTVFQGRGVLVSDFDDCARTVDGFCRDFGAVC